MHTKGMWGPGGHIRNIHQGACSTASYHAILKAPVPHKPMLSPPSPQLFIYAEDSSLVPAHWTLGERKRHAASQELQPGARLKHTRTRPLTKNANLWANDTSQTLSSLVPTITFPQVGWPRLPFYLRELKGSWLGCGSVIWEERGLAETELSSPNFNFTQ